MIEIFPDKQIFNEIQFPPPFPSRNIEEYNSNIKNYTYLYQNLIFSILKQSRNI